MLPKALVSWSGGKDSALTLWEARNSFHIQGLLTTVTEPFDRISVHGVRTELLRQQADALGLPVITIPIPFPCSNEAYETAWKSILGQQEEAGIENVLFGDLFLEDVRRYREDRLLKPGQAVFPLWGRDTARLAQEFIDLGFRALLCCVDTQVLDGSFAGRWFDDALLRDLPAEVDPCGERGEFHTLVVQGPNFRSPMEVALGERVMRENRFLFQDIIPAGKRAGGKPPPPP